MPRELILFVVLLGILCVYVACAVDLVCGVISLLSWQQKHFFFCFFFSFTFFSLFDFVIDCSRRVRMSEIQSVANPSAPLNCELWTIEEVAAWIGSLGFHEYRVSRYVVKFAIEQFKGSIRAGMLY